MAYEAFDEEVQNRRSSSVRFLVGLVVGALVVGAIWLGQWAATSRDSDDPDPSSGAAAAPASEREEATATESHHAAGRASSHDGGNGGQSGEEESDDAAAGEADALLLRCQEVFSAQEAPLQTAARSLGQWEIHIGAMNQLVAGTITLRQARRFWEQTRAGAAGRLERHDAAMDEWRERLARCPRPEHTPQGDGRIRCARAVAARTTTIRSAATSVELWREHMHHMEMLRDGEMSPAEATQEWLVSWREGDRELQAYGQARLRSAGRTC
jgi:hypothetical protein